MTTTNPWVTSWIKPSSSPAVTEFRYHPSERAAEVFARDLAHRGVQQVVVYLGPDDSTTPPPSWCRAPRVRRATDEPDPVRSIDPSPTR